MPCLRGIGRVVSWHSTDKCGAFGMYTALRLRCVAWN